MNQNLVKVLQLRNTALNVLIGHLTIQPSMFLPLMASKNMQVTTGWDAAVI